MAVSDTLWNKPVSLEEGMCCTITVGTATVLVRRQGKEIQTSFRRDEVGKERSLTWELSGEYSEETLWERFYAPSYSSINILPALPNLPVILKPSETIGFLPGEEASYFIRIPLWFQLLAKEKQKQEVILDEAETILSRTWSGTPSTGFISYFLNCELWTGNPSEEADPFSIYNPVTIRNESKKLLGLNKMCLHTENLGIFLSEGILVTNSLRATIRGENSGERIQIADRPPKSFKNAEQIGKPRVKLSDNILSKSFTLIKQVTFSD